MTIFDMIVEEIGPEGEIPELLLLLLMCSSTMLPDPPILPEAPLITIQLVDGLI